MKSVLTMNHDELWKKNRSSLFKIVSLFVVLKIDEEEWKQTENRFSNKKLFYI